MKTKEAIILNGKQLREMFEFACTTGATTTETKWDLEKKFNISVFPPKDYQIRMADRYDKKMKDIEEGTFCAIDFSQYIKNHPGEFSYELIDDDNDFAVGVALAESGQLDDMSKEECRRVSQLLWDNTPEDDKVNIKPLKPYIEDDAEITIDPDYEDFLEVLALKEACYNHLTILHKDVDEDDEDDVYYCETTRMFPTNYLDEGVQLRINFFLNEQYSEAQFFDEAQVDRIIDYLIKIKGCLGK
jgi:hypothetical protein